jgi:multidrug efflux system outer membrane protein
MVVAALLPALLLSACMTAPAYKKPDTALPAEFRSQMTPAQADSIADLPWWGVFSDPALQGLIAEALNNNYDIKVAAARIERARAVVGVVSSESKPQVGYGAAAGGDREIVAVGHDAKAPTVGSISAGLNAAWELDLWGRIEHATAAARADLLAQEDVRRGVMLTLVSDVATGYFRLLELDRELEIAKESSLVYKKTLDLFTYRFEAGRDNNLPVQRAQAAYDSSRARIADLTRLIALQENAISILVGGFPHPIARGKALPDQVMPATPAGATSDLLQRRPDILAAEQAMIGANEQIGVAVANFFPRVGLSALFGAQGLAISGGSASFGVWNAMVNVAGPIFTGGRLESAYKERQGFWDETVAQYRRTVIGAFQETSDSLVAQQTLVGRRAALESEIAALRRSSELALLRYDAGRASYFEVLEAQQQLFPAEDDLAQTQRDQLVAVVNLYKALGGGWKLKDEEWTRQAAAAPAPEGRP